MPTDSEPGSIRSVPCGRPWIHPGSDLRSVGASVPKRFRDISIDSNPDSARMRIAELYDYLSELERAGLTDGQLFYICRPAFENQLSVAVHLHLKKHELTAKDAMSSPLYSKHESLR
jgi:hypothetical protein